MPGVLDNVRTTDFNSSESHCRSNEGTVKNLSVGTTMKSAATLNTNIEPRTFVKHISVVKSQPRFYWSFKKLVNTHHHRNLLHIVS